MVIGCTDSNELVAGKGIERLQNAGINVIVGVLEADCRKHHKRFFTVQEKNRPYIILKWAETKDGFIYPELHSKVQKNVLSAVDFNADKKEEEKEISNVDSEDLKNRLLQQEKMLRKNESIKPIQGKPVWISNNYSQQLVHKLRAKEHAILVGTNTAIADNPKLNVRSWDGNNPIRIVLDKNLRIPKNTNLYDGSVKTIFIIDKKTKEFKTLINSENIIFERISFSPLGKLKGAFADQICAILQKHKIQSVIIEGGTQTLQTFIDANLWDEALVFTGDNFFGNGIKAPILSAKITSKENIKNDILKIYTND